MRQLVSHLALLQATISLHPLPTKPCLRPRGARRAAADDLDYAEECTIIKFVTGNAMKLREVEAILSTNGPRRGAAANRRDAFTSRCLHIQMPSQPTVAFCVRSESASRPSLASDRRGTIRR